MSARPPDPRWEQHGSAGLVFRERPGRRGANRDRSSSVPWLVVAVVSAILFVLVIRALLERTAWTAGGAAPAPAPLSNTAQPVSPATYVTEPMPVPMVYRCVDAAGGVSLQSQPCGPGQRTTRAVPAPPEREPIRPRQYVRAAPAGVSSYNAFPIPQGDPNAARKATCAMARQERTDTLERVGLKRTYDLLQRLDAMVRDACKGL